MGERDLLKQRAIRQNQDDLLEVVVTPTLNVGSIAAMNERRKKTGLTLTYKDQPMVLDQERPIGTGGSKQVYSVQVGERHYALAIPAADIDHPSVILQKWQAVAREPANTERIRQLGLVVNDLCQLVQVKINGTEFPGLVMRRFQDLPFEVRDSKNLHSSTGETPVLTGQSELESAFENIVGEIVILLENGVKLGEDSFNLAVVDGHAHLYFNDLGTAKFENIDPQYLENYIDAYLDSAIRAFIIGITEAEYSPIGDKFDYESLKQKLKNKLLKKLG